MGMAGGDESGALASTRDRILRAAVELFAAQGYAGVGVDTICKQAGVAKTGLYWNFGNKQGLLRAVIRLVGTSFLDDMTGAVAQAGEPAERLRLAIQELKNRISGRPELLRVLLVILLERHDLDDETREDIRQFFARASETIVSGVREPWKEALADTDLRIVGDLGVAMIIGIFILALVDPNAELDRLLNGAGEVMLRILRPRVPRTRPSSAPAAVPAPPAPPASPADPSLAKR